MGLLTMFTTSDVLQVAATVCATGAALGCLYLVFVGFSVLRFRRGEATAAPVSVPVSLLVPLCGSEPGLAARLRALRDQSYSGATEIICGTLDPNDPAIEVVRQVAAETNDGRLVCHVDPHVAGQNLKVANISNFAKHAKHEMLVLIDSDIVVGADYLAGVVAELQRPGVGAVTCLINGLRGESLWTRGGSGLFSLLCWPAVSCVFHPLLRLLAGLGPGGLPRFLFFFSPRPVFPE